jgi:DNA-binding CsgD family transcriptional regulator
MGSVRVPDGCPLSPRQFEVINLLCDGLSYHEAARRLGIAVTTVRSHVDAAHKKLGVRSTAQAVAMMGRSGWWGWIAPEPDPEPSSFVKNRPWAGAILVEFNRWLASGFADQDARDALHIAAQGACHTAGVTRSKIGPAPVNEPLRRTLQRLADDTIQPSVHVRKQAA